MSSADCFNASIDYSTIDGCQFCVELPVKQIVMARAPGLEKKPNSYDEYQTTLKPKHQEMAREELHEDDFSREPALAQMREFIAKHPQIQRCRTDAVFLLRFLRSVKFNVIAACNRLENFLVATELHAEFFKKFDESDMNDLVGSCVFVPVEKDPDDRLVIFFRAGQFDPKIFTPERQCQLGTILLETYLDIEMYHITGLVLVFDLRNTTMAHYGIWNLPKLKILMTAINELVACRIKEIHVVQIPKFAAMVADFCVAALKPKLRQRLKVRLSKSMQVHTTEVLPMLEYTARIVGC